MKRSIRSAASVTRATNVEAIPSQTKIVSRRRRRRSRSSASALAPSARAHLVQAPGGIGHQYTSRKRARSQNAKMLKASVINKKREPGGEDRLISDAAMRQITQRDLNDVGGDRGRRFHRVQSQVGLLARGNRHHHRFTDSAGDSEDEGRRDSRNCGRQHDLDRSLEFGCAYAQANRRADHSARRARRLRSARRYRE